MRGPTEDAVSALLAEAADHESELGTWLLTIGVMALGLTPLALVLAGVWGAVLISALLIFVWLASMVWVFARHGSPSSANVLPSAIMVVAWPAIGILFGII